VTSTRGGSSRTAWEWNLRDLSRWAELASHFAKTSKAVVDSVAVSLAFNAVYLARLDAPEAASAVVSLFGDVMSGLCTYVPFSGSFSVTHDAVKVGRVVVKRGSRGSLEAIERTGECDFAKGPLRLLRGQLQPLETLLACVEMNWVAILVSWESCLQLLMGHLINISFPSVHYA
jgi:midasin